MIVFQSTPVIANGRIGDHRISTPAFGLSFNPRPLLLTGESRGHRSAGGPAGRFNPRPLLLTGESTIPGHDRIQRLVSIHARYC